MLLVGVVLQRFVESGKREREREREKEKERLTADDNKVFSGSKRWTSFLNREILCHER